MNSHEPATKADVAEAKSELKQEIADVKSELKQDLAEVKQDVAMLRSEMHHMHDALLERIDDKETKLLEAFYTFAQSNQTRMATVETDSEAVRKRVGILEERVLQLERKVNFPNSPPQ